MQRRRGRRRGAGVRREPHGLGAVRGSSAHLPLLGHGRRRLLTVLARDVASVRDRAVHGHRTAGSHRHRRGR